MGGYFKAILIIILVSVSCRCANDVQDVLFDARDAIVVGLATLCYLIAACLGLITSIGAVCITSFMVVLFSTRVLVLGVRRRTARSRFQSEHWNPHFSLQEDLLPRTNTSE